MKTRAASHGSGHFGLKNAVNRQGAAKMSKILIQRRQKFVHLLWRYRAMTKNIKK